MNTFKRVLYSSSLFFMSFFSHAHKEVAVTKLPAQHWIIIHGTFAAQEKWCKEGGPFFEAIKKSLAKTTSNHFKISSFSWSGYNNHSARLKAAQELITVIKTIPQDCTIHIVGHSHGATVVFLAAELLFLQKSPIHIKELFALGSPIYVPWYENSFRQIETIYNFFSYGDLVQPVVSIFKRTLPEAAHIHNIQIKINHASPRHNELYSPILGHYLPSIALLISEPAPYCFHFKKTAFGFVGLEITKDEAREKDLETDSLFMQNLINNLASVRKNLYEKNSNNPTSKSRTP